jgi:Uma2 family endonuclease
MITSTQPVTADDLLQMERSGRYQLVRGELRRMQFADNIHGRVVMIIAGSLHAHVIANRLGNVYAAETGFLLATDPDTVRASDVAFVRRERLEQVGDVEGYWPGAPDLAVEVTSPNDRFTEVEGEVFDWLEAGSSMVIVVNPKKRTATVYRSNDDITVLSEEDMLSGYDVVKEWKMRVGDMFRGL